MYGAQSEESTPVRIIVEAPGYVRLGSIAVSVLSVFIPLLALLFITIFGLWYVLRKLFVWKKKVQIEVDEAENKLTTELDEVITHLHTNVAELKESRKGKLTKAELMLIEQIEADLQDARQKIRKEITDIENVVQ
jgi:hypothetical protein